MNDTDTVVGKLRRGVYPGFTKTSVIKRVWKGNSFTGNAGDIDVLYIGPSPEEGMITGSDKKAKSGNQPTYEGIFAQILCEEKLAEKNITPNIVVVNVSSQEPAARAEHQRQWKSLSDKFSLKTEWTFVDFKLEAHSTIEDPFVTCVPTVLRGISKNEQHNINVENMKDIDELAFEAEEGQEQNSDQRYQSFKPSRSKPKNSARVQVAPPTSPVAVEKRLRIIYVHCKHGRHRSASALAWLIALREHPQYDTEIMKSVENFDNGELVNAETISILDKLRRGTGDIHDDNHDVSDKALMKVMDIQRKTELLFIHPEYYWFFIQFMRDAQRPRYTSKPVGFERSAPTKQAMCDFQTVLARSGRFRVTVKNDGERAVVVVVGEAAFQVTFFRPSSAGQREPIIHDPIMKISRKNAFDAQTAVALFDGELIEGAPEEAGAPHRKRIVLFSEIARFHKDKVDKDGNVKEGHTLLDQLKKTWDFFGDQYVAHGATGVSPALFRMVGKGHALNGQKQEITHAECYLKRFLLLDHIDMALEADFAGRSPEDSLDATDGLIFANIDMPSWSSGTDVNTLKWKDTHTCDLVLGSPNDQVPFNYEGRVGYNGYYATYEEASEDNKPADKNGRHGGHGKIFVYAPANYLLNEMYAREGDVKFENISDTFPSPPFESNANKAIFECKFVKIDEKDVSVWEPVRFRRDKINGNPNRKEVFDACLRLSQDGGARNVSCKELSNRLGSALSFNAGKGAQNRRTLEQQVHNRSVKAAMFDTLFPSAAGRKKVLLDMACGRFNDMFSWERLVDRIESIFGIDISENQLHEGVRRVNETDDANRGDDKKALLAAVEYRPCDATDTVGFAEILKDFQSLEKPKTALGKADVVVCSFAVTHFFRNEATLGAFFENARRAINPEGGLLAVMFAGGDAVWDFMEKGTRLSKQAGRLTITRRTRDLCSTQRTDVIGTESDKYGEEIQWENQGTEIQSPEYLAWPSLLLEAAAAHNLVPATETLRTMRSNLGRQDFFKPPDTGPRAPRAARAHIFGAELKEDMLHIVANPELGPGRQHTAWLSARPGDTPWNGSKGVLNDDVAGETVVKMTRVAIFEVGAPTETPKGI